MIICKNCGVELEESMPNCPLCGLPVTNGNQGPAVHPQQPLIYNREMSPRQRKFTWDIISLILLSATVAAFIIDFIISRKITWSEYPVAISLVIFSYVSLFAFWRHGTLIIMAAGFVLSAACMVAVDAFTGGIQWALLLGMPALFAVSVIVAAYMTIVRLAKHKGVNLLAWGFLCAALLCICLEAVLSYYRTQTVRLAWSVIAGGAALPVVLVLLFVHFRLRKGRSLEKTFHI